MTDCFQGVLCKDIAEKSSSTWFLNLSGSISVRRSDSRIRCLPLPHRTINTSDPRHILGAGSLYPYGLPKLDWPGFCPQLESVRTWYFSKPFPLNLLHNIRQSRNPWILRCTCISCVEHQWKEGLNTEESELGWKVFNSLARVMLSLLSSYHIRPAFVLVLYDMRT